MKSGTLKAVFYEVKNGNIWTVLDEIWHVFDNICPNCHAKFCQLAHRKD